ALARLAAGRRRSLGRRGARQSAAPPVQRRLTGGAGPSGGARPKFAAKQQKGVSGMQKKSTAPDNGAVLKNFPGTDLLSRPVARAVPSALEGLTAVFGMGTGVSPPLCAPEKFVGL